MATSGPFGVGGFGVPENPFGTQIFSQPNQDGSGAIPTGTFPPGIAPNAGGGVDASQIPIPVDGDVRSSPLAPKRLRDPEGIPRSSGGGEEEETTQPPPTRQGSPPSRMRVSMYVEMLL